MHKRLPLRAVITYPLHERFLTFQGEGCHMGVSAFFIRTFGCPVRCPFCDSAGTWHPHYIPKDIVRFTAEQLADEAIIHHPDCVVITGGEPAIHDLAPLCEALHEHELPVHLETSGAFKIRGLFEWITLSPKRWALPLAENLILADEFKIIIESPGDIAWYLDMMRELGLPELCKTPIWLHPEWSHRNDLLVLRAITETVKTMGSPFRAGYQLHKLYQADAGDLRSRPVVPLGGNVAKGF